jgi:hypothetical protein
MKEKAITNSKTKVDTLVSQMIDMNAKIEAQIDPSGVDGDTEAALLRQMLRNHLILNLKSLNNPNSKMMKTSNQLLLTNSKCQYHQPITFKSMQKL